MTNQRWMGPYVTEVAGDIAAVGGNLDFLFSLLFSPTIIFWYTYLCGGYFMATFSAEIKQCARPAWIY